MIPLNDILKLSLSERILWVETIWNSIASEKTSSTSLKLSTDQKAFLDDELADYKKNPKSGSGWNELKSRIKSKK